MGQLVFEEQSLSEVVREAPIIVIGRLSRPEPELRTIEVAVENEEGQKVDFRFQGAVWRFAVTEVLKAEGAAAPEGEIEVVRAGLQTEYDVTYEYEVEGVSVSPIERRNATAYVRDVHDLGERAAVLFLAPPPDSSTERDDPYLAAFGRAYEFAVWPGLEDPALKDRVLELIRADAD